MQTERPDRGRGGGLLQAGLFAVSTLLLIALTSRSTNEFALKRGERVLLADFVDTTEESTLGPGLKQALTLTLEESRHLLLFPESRIRRALKQMGQDSADAITPETAARICAREGIPVFLVPSVSRSGDTYLLRIRLVGLRNGNQKEMPIDTQRANSEAELIFGIDELGVKIRRELGESNGSLTTSGRVLAPAALENPEALLLFVRALALEAKENYDGATAILKQTIALNRRFALAQLKLAEIHARLGQKEAAIELAAQAERDAESLPLKERYRARGLYRMLNQEYAAAREQYEALAAIYPGDCRTQLRLAELDLLQREFQEAQRHCEKAIALDDARVESHLGLCMAYLFARKPDAARKAWESASALDSGSPAVVITGGLIDLVENNLGSALRAFRQISESSHSQTRSLGLFLTAQAQIYGARFQSALATLEEGIVVDKKRGNLDSEISKHLARAQVFLLIGDSTGAMAECERIPRIYCRAEDLARLGAIYAQTGRIADAQNLLGQIRTLPALPRNNYHTAILEGEIDLAAGNAPSAVVRLSRIAEKPAGGPRPFEPLARALAQAGRFEEGAQEYQAICEQKAELLFPPSGSWFMGTWANALFEMGRCLDNLGRAAEARQYFRSYLWVLDGADPGLAKIQRAREQLTKRASRTGSP